MNKTLGILFILLAIMISSCQFPSPGSSSTPFPTLFIPTPDCGRPTLLLGSNTFQIETVQPAADGSISIPGDTSGTAYWVDGAIPHYIFVLSPMPENMAAMDTLTVGSTARRTWSNCNSTTYVLSGPQQGSFDASTLPDQSVEGITIFFETDPSGASVIFTGDLTGEQISTFNTPEPGVADVQAEISLLETAASPDGTAVKIGVSIQNYGTGTLVLSTGDVSLTQPDGAILNLASSEPLLPKEIPPGATESVYFTFPRPSSETATLKIFTVEYDIEGY